MERSKLMNNFLDVLAAFFCIWLQRLLNRLLGRCIFPLMCQYIKIIFTTYDETLERWTEKIRENVLFFSFFFPQTVSVCFTFFPFGVQSLQTRVGVTERRGNILITSALSNGHRVGSNIEVNFCRKRSVIHELGLVLKFFHVTLYSLKRLVIWTFRHLGEGKGILIFFSWCILLRQLTNYMFRKIKYINTTITAVTGNAILFFNRETNRKMGMKIVCLKILRLKLTSLSSFDMIYLGDSGFCFIAHSTYIICTSYDWNAFLESIWFRF